MVEGTTKACIRCGDILGASCKTGICRTCREATVTAYRGHKDPEGRAELELFAEEFHTCWLCGWPEKWNNKGWRLHIHHIYGGSSRKHIRANLSRLCDSCHALAHKSELKKEHVLWLKLRYDSGGHSPKALKMIVPHRIPRATKPVTLLKRYT